LHYSRNCNMIKDTNGVCDVEMKRQTLFARLLASRLFWTLCITCICYSIYAMYPSAERSRSFTREPSTSEVPLVCNSCRRIQLEFPDLWTFRPFVSSPPAQLLDVSPLRNGGFAP